MDWNEETKTLTITTSNTTLYAQTEHRSDAVTVLVNGPVTSVLENVFINYQSLENLLLPDSVQYMSNNVIQGTKIRSFHIPLNFNSIDYRGPFDWDDYLEEFTIDPNHEYLRVVDGVLYSKNMTILYCIPSNKNSSIFTIPYGVDTIYHSATNNIRQIKQILIPQTLLNGGALYYWFKVSEPKIDVFRFTDQSDDSFHIDSAAFYKTNYTRANISFIHKNYYPTFHENEKFINIITRTNLLKENFNDTYFSNVGEINRVEVGKGIRYLHQESFCSTCNITFILYNQEKTIQQCITFYFHYYMFVLIPIYL